MLKPLDKSKKAPSPAMAEELKKRAQRLRLIAKRAKSSRHR
jgi:hypothetical protein